MLIERLPLDAVRARPALVALGSAVESELIEALVGRVR
jgi:hypothetical protein